MFYQLFMYRSAAQQLLQTAATQVLVPHQVKAGSYTDPSQVRMRTARKAHAAGGLRMASWVMSRVLGGNQLDMPPENMPKSMGPESSCMQCPLEPLGGLLGSRGGTCIHVVVLCPPGQPAQSGQVSMVQPCTLSCGPGACDKRLESAEGGHGGVMAPHYESLQKPGRTCLTSRAGP